MVLSSHSLAASILPPESPVDAKALQTELSAMREIAVALSHLDEPTRARVMRWAEERFRGGATVVLPPPALYAVARTRPGADPPPNTDEALSVSTLDDFFDPTVPKVSEERATEVPDQSVTGMLHDFVEEFQDVVREWNVACSVPADRRTEPVVSVVSERTRSQRASKVT